MASAADVTKQFTSRLTSLIEYHEELLVAVQGKRRQVALEKMLAEQFSFNVVVLLEGFLSDVLVAYLAMSPQRYSRSLKERLTASIKERYGVTASGLINFKFPNDISSSKLRKLIDPKQFNLTFTSAEKLSARANELLEAQYARLFTLDAVDAEFLNFTIALRNFLAHRSKSSRATLNETVSQLSGDNLTLSPLERDIGAYLRVRNSDDVCRSVEIASRIGKIASKFS